MTTPTELLPADTFDPLRLAAAAYLARYKGWSRVHNESDLRCWLGWCAERNVPPLTAQRVHIELFIRWLQEVRHLNLPPSPGAPQSSAAFTAHASSTGSSNIPQPNTSAGRTSQPSHRPSG